jgi:tetratricopeptide (TPR) repeat protein
MFAPPPAQRPSRRRLFVWGLLLALAGGALYLADREVRYRLHDRAARRALGGQAGGLRPARLASAQAHLDACLEIRPNNPELRLLAARTARRRRAYDDAERHLAAAEALQGVVPATALERGLLLAQQGELAGVDGPLLSLVVNGHPDQPLILEALAQGFLEARRLLDARDCLNRLLELEPGHFQAYVWRGTVFEKLGRRAEALADYRQAVELVPASSEARLHLAETLYRLGCVREAAGHYEGVRAAEPGNPAVLLGLARCRADCGQLEEAGQVLDALLAEHPDMVPALVERGRLALHTGQADRAEQWLRTAVARAPYDRDAVSALHVCLEARGKAAEDRDCVARLRRLDADEERKSTLLSRVLASPHDPAFRYDLGMLLLRTGQEEEGVSWLQSALREDPGHQPARAALEEYGRRAGQAGPATRPDPAPAGPARARGSEPSPAQEYR